MKVSVFSFAFLTVLLTGCTVVPKIPFVSTLFNSNQSRAAAISSGNATSAAITQIADADRRLQEARAQMEEQYEEYRQGLEHAYQQREEVDLANFAAISRVNYGIYYVTDTERKNTDLNTFIANLRAKENMARLDPLTEEQRETIRAEVNEERQQAVEELLIKYEERVRDGLLATAAYEEATRVIEQKEAETARLREENAITLQRLQAERTAELLRIQNDSELKVEAAREEARLAMLQWIIKALAVTGIIQLIIGLLQKSTTFIIAGIFTLGLAYVAVMVPFWVVISCMGVIIISMVMVDPRTGKCHIPFTNKCS